MAASKLEIGIISAYAKDSNEIPTGMPMFFSCSFIAIVCKVAGQLQIQTKSVNTERQMGMLSDIWVLRKSKMAAINRK